MTFITSEEVEKKLRELGVTKVLEKYGRYRIAPGFTVADYVKIGEFYMTAGEYLEHKDYPADTDTRVLEAH
jgi:hypothetical protein